MKQIHRILLGLILTPLALSACQTVEGTKKTGTTYSVIDSAATFNDTIVGKKLKYKKDHVVTIFPDGTWRGEWGTSVIHGDWNWIDGAFCRTINTGQPKDCQKFELSQDKQMVRVTRNRGSGFSFNYRIIK